MEHTCARTLHWDDSAAVSACSPVSKLAHAILRRQRDRAREVEARERNVWKNGRREDNKKGEGQAALCEWGIRGRRLEVEDDIIW